MSDKHYCLYCMSPCAAGSACPKCGLTGEKYKPEPHHLPPNTVLNDRYLVGRVLGEGGFGITYIGFDMKLELKVAIKEYFPIEMVGRNAGESLSVHEYASYATNFEEGKKKFLREARAMARMIKQPEIVNVREYFESNNTTYIIMEFINGITYKELVEQQKGHLSTDEILSTFEPLFDALTNLHAEGLIHRDISPDNLMLENGKIRLLDFGCARDTASSDATRTIMTKHGYAPLEQYGNGRQGPWTDVYALSATIYFCITGKKPPQALDRTIEDSLVPPRKLGAKLTEAQEAGLLSGMAVRPSKRTRSIKELHTALYSGGVGDTVVKGVKTFFGSKRRSLYVLLGCLVVCLGLGLGYMLSRPPATVPADSMPFVTSTAEPQPTESATAVPRTAFPTDTLSMLRALSDDSVTEVVYRDGVGIGSTLHINKPVRVQKDLENWGSIVIGEGGSLTVEKGARLACTNILRTVNGGRLIIEEGAAFEPSWQSLLMLERDTDVEGGERIAGIDGAIRISQRPTTDRQPVYVTTLAELVNSQSYNDEYVVITGEINAGDQEIALSSPWVEIAEGARLQCKGLELNGGNLFVYGTLSCPHVRHGIGTLVNAGTVEGAIQLDAPTVNLGDMSGAVSISQHFYNLAESWSPSSLYDRGWIVNAGGMTLAGADNVVIDRTLVNNGVIDVQGTLRLTECSNIAASDYTTLNVNGLLTLDDSRIESNGSLLVPQGGHVEQLGSSFIHSQYGYYEGFDENSVTPSRGLQLPGSVFQDHWDNYDVMPKTVEELQGALSDATVQAIGLLDATIEYVGDLVLNKPFAINQGSTLKVAGNLTIQKDFAMLGDGRLEVTGDINLEPGVTANLCTAVTARALNMDGAFARTEADMRLSVTSVTLKDSQFADLGSMPTLEAGKITLTGNSHMVLYYAHEQHEAFAGAEVQVGDGSVLHLLRSGRYPADITVAKGGTLKLYDARMMEGLSRCSVEGTIELTYPGKYNAPFQIKAGGVMNLASAGTYAFGDACVIEGTVTGAEGAVADFPENAEITGTVEVGKP